MTQRNERAIKILDKMVTSSVISDDGADWLVSAVDPFHDRDVTLAGYPDMQSASTVVQLVKKQFLVTMPTSITSSTWDCQVTMFPTLSQANGTPNVLAILNNQATANTPVGNMYGGIVATACAGGQQIFPDNGTFPLVSSQLAIAGNANPIEYIKGRYRVIGCAFEVHNTTAEIYKQGLVTCGRVPTSPVLTELYGNYVNGGANVVTNSPFQALRAPPGFLNLAKLLYGSRSWEAKEGAYVVGRLNQTDIPLCASTAMPIGYLSADYPNNNTSQYYLAPANGQYIATSAGTNFAFYPTTNYDKVTHFDTSFAYFTGLSTQTSLVVDCRWIIERCPTTDEFDLVVLATPSACYDPVALEMYSRALCNLPPGVPLDENPLGEWFARAMSALAQWAPTVGNALGVIHPGFAAIGNGIGATAGFIRGVLPQSRSDASIVHKAPTIPKEQLQNNKKKKPVKKKVQMNVRAPLQRAS